MVTKMPFLLLLLLLVASPIYAADENGYEAEYECRAGGPNCSVDVADITTKVCEQTITTADSEAQMESKLNGGSRVICIQPGDYTGKGTINITSNGSSGAYKVFRYTRSGDTDDDPWNQSVADQARIRYLEIEGADFWIIHRLTFPTETSHGVNRILINAASASNNVIFNRLYIKGAGTVDAGYSAVRLDSNFAGSEITLQNSVIHDSIATGSTQSPVGVDFKKGTNLRIVNNEIFDWREHPIQIGANGNPKPVLPGLVIENNDIYAQEAIVSSTESVIGWLLSIKASGTEASPAKIIHNRLWGSRQQSGGTPDSSHAIGANTPSNYVLIQNNIVTDSLGALGIIDGGTNGPSENVSVIGNLLYKFQGVKRNGTCGPIVDIGDATAIELYLNTTIDSKCSGSNPRTWDWGSGITNMDLMCNALIYSDVSDSSVPGSTSIADFNVFYDTPPFSFNASDTHIEKSVVTRANSTAYSSGQVMRRTADLSLCTAVDDPDCFLYITALGGTTAASEPTFATTLGGTFQDGSVTWRAIRGPYSFFRKLKTAPEQIVIPYARLHETAPEAKWCARPGTRTGIGVDDTTPW